MERIKIHSKVEFPRYLDLAKSDFAEIVVKWERKQKSKCI